MTPPPTHHRRRMPPRLREALALRPWQRHSLVLAVAGTVYAFVGIGYTLAPPSPARDSALRLALDWMPLHSWGIVWILTGLLAIMSARWPPASETWGYTAMTALSSGWAMFYLLGIPLGAPVALGATGVLVWGLMGFLWWAVSGLRNPERLV